MSAAAILAARPRDRGLLLAALPVLAAVVAVPVVPPVAVIGGLLLAAVAVAVVVRPQWALVGLLFLEPFHHVLVVAASSHWHVDFGPLTLWKDVLIAALAVRGVVEQVRRGGLRLPRVGLQQVVAGYVIVLLLLTTASPDWYTAGYGLSTVIGGPLLFVAIATLELPRRVMWMALAAILAAAGIMAVAALAEQGPKEGFIAWYGAPPAPLGSAFYSGSGRTGYRSGSFLDHPLVLAFYLAAAIPLALAVAASARQLAHRALGALLLGLTAAAMYFTNTRSGYIGGLAGLLVAIPMVVRGRRQRLGALAAVTVVLGGLVMASLGGYTDVLARSDDKAHGDQLTRDLEQVSANPLGYGLGSIDAVGQRFGVTSVPVGGASESTFFAKALQGGLIELAAYLIVLFALATALFTAWRRARDHDPPVAGLLGGALGALTAVAVAGLFLGQEQLVVDLVWWGAAGLGLTMARRSLGASETATAVAQPTPAPVRVEATSTGTPPRSVW